MYATISCIQISAIMIKIGCKNYILLELKLDSSYPVFLRD